MARRIDAQSTKCSFKSDQVPLAMNPSTFEGVRGRRRHHETRCSWIVTGDAAPFVVQFTKVRQFAHEFPNSKLMVTMNQVPRGESVAENARLVQTAPSSSLGSQLPSWSSPPNVRRCTHEFKIAQESMNQAPSMGTCGRRLYHETPCSWVFTGVTALFVFNPRKVSRRTYELSSKLLVTMSQAPSRRTVAVLSTVTSGSADV